MVFIWIFYPSCCLHTVGPACHLLAIIISVPVADNRGNSGCGWLTQPQCLHSSSVRSCDLVVRWWWWRRWVGCVAFLDDIMLPVLPQSFWSFFFSLCELWTRIQQKNKYELHYFGRTEAINFLHNVREWKQHGRCEESFMYSVLLMLITFPLMINLALFYIR